MNQLLSDLQHGGAAANSSSPAAQHSPGQQTSSRPAAFATPSVAVANLSASEQIARVQQWLDKFNSSLQQTNHAAQPSIAALDTLAQMHTLVASHPLPFAGSSFAAAPAASPSFVAPTSSPLPVPTYPATAPLIGTTMQQQKLAPQSSPKHEMRAAIPAASPVPSSSFSTPSALSLGLPSSSPSSSSSSSSAAASSSSSSAVPPKRSALITIKPLQSVASLHAGQPQMAGVTVPAGTVFVNGKWIRQAAAANGQDDHNDSEDEADPFADFSDHDASLPSTPRRGSNAMLPQPSPPQQQQQQQPAQLLHPQQPFQLSSRAKKASMSLTMRRRVEGEMDIGEEDVAEFEDRETVGNEATGRRASLPPPPAVVLQDGQWQTGGDTIADEEDVFADIEDLPVNAEEEERVRVAELARAAASAAAARAASPSSPYSRSPRSGGGSRSGSLQKSAAEIAKRTLAIQRKTTTMRPNLFKHMGQDAEIDDQDMDPFDSEPDDEPAQEKHEEDDQDEEKEPTIRSSRPPSARNAVPPVAAAAAAGVAAGSPMNGAAAAIAAANEDELDVDAALNSPRAARFFAPDLSAPKSAPGVTALNTRKEGQQQEEEEWDMDLKLKHLRHASHSASAPFGDERPDDLDDLDEIDDDVASPISKQSRSGGAASAAGGVGFGSLSDLSAPATPSSAVSRHGATSDEDDFSDVDVSSSGGAFGGRNNPFTSTTRSGSSMHSGSGLHSHSHSASSQQSNHGQLSGHLSSDDDMDQLDDLLDEDECKQSLVKVDVNNKANFNRATRNRETQRHNAQWRWHERSAVEESQDLIVVLVYACLCVCVE